MAEPARRDTSSERVRRHRRKAIAEGSRRVEVTVPDEDAALVREVARTLRRGGRTAEALRSRIAAAIVPPRAQTGRELVAFLRSSPLGCFELDIERDRSTGRVIDLE